MQNGGTTKKCDCSVEFLLVTPFKTLKAGDKIAIFKRGRSTPQMTIEQLSTGDAFVRHFHSSNYDLFGWLCGCKALNRLFCWPCLLFGQEKTVWNNSGYIDLRNFAATAKRHQLTPHHLIGFKELKQFEKVFGNAIRAKPVATKEMKQALQLYNLKVKRNRTVFMHLVRAVGSLSKTLPLGEIGKKKAVKDQCSDTIKLICSYDEDFKRFALEKKDSIFLEMKVVADILATCLVLETKKEIAESEFVSFILDGIVDETMKSYVVVTLRFVKKNGDVVERCVKLFNSDKLSSDGIAKEVKDIINDMDCASKILGFTYDGVAIRSCDFLAFNSEVIKFCHYSAFAYGYIHDINYVLIQSVSEIDKVRIFLSSLSTFYDLFLKTFKKLDLLDDEIIKDVVTLKSDNNIEIMKRIYRNRLSIVARLKSMTEKTFRFDSVVVANLNIMLRFLQDVDFNFMLILLSSICIKCEPLSNANVYDVKQFIRDFQSNLEYQKSNFTAFWNGLTNTVTKVSGSAYISEDKAKMALLYNNILFTMMNVLDKRYAKADRMLMYALLDPRNFKKFHCKFPPKEYFHMLMDWHFASQLSRDLLKTELEAIYSDPEFYSVFDLHGYMLYQGLDEVFPETFKLCLMLKVMPVDAMSGCASQRIRNYPHTVTHSAILNIEKDRVEELMKQEVFLEKLLDVIASKIGKKEFTYKTYLEDVRNSVQETESSAATAASYSSEISPKETRIGAVFNTQGPSQPGPSREHCEEDSVQLSMTCDVQPDIPCLESEQPDKRPKLEPAAGVAEESSVDLLQCPVLIKEEIISSDEEL